MYTPPNIDWTAPTPPTLGASKAAWQDIRNIVATLPDVTEAKTLMIANGRIVPNSSCIRLETEGGAASDILTVIDMADFPAGHRVYLSLANEARLVTVEHRGGGIGQIDLAGKQDMVLTSTKQWLCLERKGTEANPGTEWEEVQVVPPIGTLALPLKRDVHFGNYGVAGAKPIPKLVTGSTRTYDPSFNPNDPVVGDNGKKLVFTNASGCTMTLPAGGVQIEDYFVWEQRAAGQIIFQPAAGAALVNCLGHDRSYGDGAIGVCHVRSVSPVEWVLNGTTAAAGTGGGGGGGGGTGARTLAPPAFATSATTVTDTTYTNVNGAGLTHIPGDNETWLYLFNSVISAGAAGDAANPAMARAWHETSDTTVGEWGRGRFPEMREASVGFYVRTYGTANTAQTYRLQIKNGSATAGDSVTCSSGGIAAIRLEADEAGTFVATNSTNATTTYATAATLNLTAVADEYLILVSADIGATTTVLANMRVIVDGATYHEKTYTRAGPNYGRLSVLVAATFTAGSKTITLQHRANAAGSTSQVRNVCIAAIRKGKFPYWHTASDHSEEGLSSSTAWAAKLTLQAGLVTGWQYLVLAGCDAFSGTDANGAYVRTRIMRNGAQLGEEAHTGTRLGGAWGPTGPCQMVLAQLQQAQDTFELQWAGASSSYQFNLKGAVIAVLGLRQLV